MDDIMLERFEKALYSKGFTDGYLKGAADQTTKIPTILSVRAKFF